MPRQRFLSQNVAEDVGGADTRSYQMQLGSIARVFVELPIGSSVRAVGAVDLPKTRVIDRE